MPPDAELPGDPLDVRIPDDWGPEQVAVVMEFLEVVLQALDRQYGLSVLQLHHDREQERLDSHPARTRQNFRMPQPATVDEPPF